MATDANPEQQQDDGAAERLKQIKDANAKADADAKQAAKDAAKPASDDTDPELPAPTPKSHRK